MIKLGSTVKDKISGFEGVVVARTQYLYGCVRLEVDPNSLKDGDLKESACFDEPQLEVVSEPDIDLLPPEKRPRVTHGPHNPVTRRADFIRNIRETKG